MRQPNWEVMSKVLDRITTLAGKSVGPLPGATRLTRFFAEQVKLHFLEQGIPFDDASALELGMFVAFKVYGAPIYKIGREFGHVLHDVDCRIDPKFIRFDDTVMCIEFPDDMWWDFGDGHQAACSYVMLHNDPTEVTVTGIPVTRALKLITPLYDAAGNYSDVTDKVRIPFDDPAVAGMGLEQVIEYSINNTTRATGHSAEFLKYLLKCILYIQSGEPDLSLWKPSHKPHNAKAIKRWRRDYLCDLPLIRVGFNYKKPVVYSKDQTAVTGHWRWQPYGPERDRVKLIWIKDHIRRFKEHHDSGVSLGGERT
jgi:hypothetical protein